MKIGAIIISENYPFGDEEGSPLMMLGKKHLLEWGVDLLQMSGISTIVAVTGQGKSEVKKEAQRLDIQTVHNKRYHEGGVSSSVSAGASWLRRVKKLDAFFILPVHIPLIRPVTLATLIAQKGENDVAYPTLLKQRGCPPLFSAKLISSLVKYNGKGGLKAFLEKKTSIDVPVWDEGILLNARSPKQFEQLQKRVSHMGRGSRLEVEILSELIMRKRGQEHGRAVADIACKLGERLNKKGGALDLEILFNSSLLHDIAKGEAHHAEKGAEVLKDLGLTQLAPIVSAHRDTHYSKSGELTEKEIVCLADKLVRGTSRMPVKERFGEKIDLNAADGTACKAMKRRLANVQKIESVVVDCLGTSLEDLLKLGKKC